MRSRLRNSGLALACFGFLSGTVGAKDAAQEPEAVPAAALPAAATEVRRCRLELLEGRAHLAGPGGVNELLAGGAAEIEGPGYLEVRARSRAALRWNAVASLVIEGPAVIEWGPPAPGGVPAGAHGGIGGGALEWRIEELFEAHLEVRRGPVHVHLAGGWGARLEAGAGFLRGIAGGGVEWRHDAGSPVLLSAPHAPQAVRPPWVVLAGAWLRLHPGRERPEVMEGFGGRVQDPYLRRGSSRGEGPLPSWPSFSWPWEAEPGLLERTRPAGPASMERMPIERETAEPRPQELPDAVREPTAPALPPQASLRAEPEPSAQARTAAPDEDGSSFGPSNRVPSDRAVPRGITLGSAGPQPLDVELELLEARRVEAPRSAEPSGEPAHSAQADVFQVDPRPTEPDWRPYAEGGVLRLTPWGVRRFREPRQQ